MAFIFIIIENNIKVCYIEIINILQRGIIMTTGQIIGIIIAVAVILVLIYIFTTYNSLVKLKNKVEEAFSTMDVYLKKRWDLIPNIVSTVKGYAKHEAETLENVIKARNSNYQNMSEEEKIEAKVFQISVYLQSSILTLRQTKTFLI